MAAVMRHAFQHASWADAAWPDHVQPVPLGSDMRPLDPSDLASLPPHKEFLFIAPGASVLNPDLGAIVQAAVRGRHDVNLFYSDDATIGSDGSVRDVACKPAFNVALLLADDYIGLPVIVRASSVKALLGERQWTSASWYRLCLGALANGSGIERIPQTLIASPTSLPRLHRDLREQVLTEWLSESNEPYVLRPGRNAHAIELSRVFQDYPPVTIVIPTRQAVKRSEDGAASHRLHLSDCLDSIGRSSYPLENVTIIIGDDADSDDVYIGRQDRFSIKRIETRRGRSEAFNYAAKMNRLWRAASTDALIFLNDDIVVREEGWIEALLTYALDPGVGGVGARLLFPDMRIQHAGMFGGILGVCAHPWYLAKADDPTYRDWATTARDCSAVTGAVFATRRQVMQSLDGFDERFSLDFNDVDLCFRMRMLGYRVVYTPHAELFHHESASRAKVASPGSQVALYMRRWRDVLADDPMYSPQLTTHSELVAPKTSATAWIEGQVRRYGA